MTDFFQNYLVILIETTCCMMFFEIFEDDKNRETGVYSRWLYIAGLSLITNIEVYYIQVFLIRQIIDAVITALVFAFYFKEKIRKCLILSVVFSGILWLADFITVIIYPTLIREESKDKEIVSLLVLILAKLILFLMIVVMNNMFRDNYTEYIRERDWLTFMFLPIFSIATAAVFVKKAPAVKGSGLETFFVGLAIGLVFMNVMMFYFIKNIGKREYLLREQGLMELEARNKLQLYETVSDTVQRQRQISHEYKNQIACIQSLVECGDYEELREYLEQIRGEVLHDLDQIDTNHAIVNAVLNAKYQEAVSRGIVVICRVNDLSGLAMDSSDLVILLSNLLNNAIEACVRYQGERLIKIKCIFEEDEFIFSVRNTYDGKLKKIGKNLFTIKKNESESHGFGLKNAIQTIERNNGYYAIEHTDEEFYISVVIPQETRH